jgi:hypothetical protein
VARPRSDLVRIREILCEGIDYPRLLQLAQIHGVRPSLIRRLGEVSWQSVPVDIRAQLEAFQSHHLARTLNLFDELRRVTTLFSDNGISFVIFKGPVLAMARYGDLAHREYNDIDVIVPERQMAEAERLLASLNYRNDQGEAAFRHAFLAHQRQYRFALADSNAAIDLHWGFAGSHVPFPLAPAEIWNDPARLSVGGRRIPTLSAANLALLLAGHGTKEGWLYLKWVCDFAYLIDRAPDLDWLGIHRRARSQGCGDSVLLGCLMAQALLESPIPGALAPLIEQRGRLIALATSLILQMRQGLPPANWQEYFTDLALCDGQLDRVRAVLRLVFTPTTGDYAALKLPQVLWPAYYAIRPLRLAANAIAGLCRRARRSHAFPATLS